MLTLLELVNDNLVGGVNYRQATGHITEKGGDGSFGDYSVGIIGSAILGKRMS